MANCLSADIACNFADQIRSARESATRDGEDFQSILHAIERLGSFLTGELSQLGKYAVSLKELCVQSEDCGLPPFDSLFCLVREARNDALHQGAFARHLTRNCIELALRLEDSLRTLQPRLIEHYMVRSPLCAELWQPLSFIRQQMLANAFSFMPVKMGNDLWGLVSDVALAKHLRIEHQATRKERMTTSLSESGIPLAAAQLLSEKDNPDKALAVVSSGPVLVHRQNDEKTLIGILTAFDLL